ncbi:MAG: universal stress protein [Chloroflexi bacterium]|nr:universal stress protein [Chloroflexota bacterium]
MPLSAPRRILVATDRSASADEAVHWAANLARTLEADLLLLQVLVPPSPEAPVDDRLTNAQAELQVFAEQLAGSRGRARVVVDDDPASAILEAIVNDQADVVALGNLGMRGRKEFLLGNIPNRVSHNARCTVVIVNTATESAVPPGTPASTRRYEPGSAPPNGHLIARTWRIGRVMVRAGLRDALERTPTDIDRQRLGAQRLRAALDELGPTFAKIGQILSTRPDLLPPAYIEELATLQEHVTPLTEAEVVAAMERELGVPWEDVFGSIDGKPLAAGTIAQVHRATLENGDRVVVKIQRPSAEQDILQDLELLEMFASRVGSRPSFRRVVDLPAMVEDLSKSLRRELDFRREADNLRRMREVLAPFSRLAVPAVYEEYSTSRLLVMQEIQGVPVREAPPGPARTEAARQLLEAYYAQVLGQGFFHADPHPGNMKWWNDTIYLLDLGMVGELEPEVRELLLLLVLAFAQQDAAFLAETVQLLAGQPGSVDTSDLEAFQQDLAELIARYRSLSIKEIQLGPLFQEITQIAIRHHVRVPPSLALAGKAFSQMQLVAAQLDPNLDPFGVAQAYLMRRTIRQMVDGMQPQRMFYEVEKARHRVVRLISALESITGARPGADMRVEFRSRELEASLGKLGKRLSMGLGLGGAMIAAAVLARARAGRTRS